MKQTIHGNLVVVNGVGMLILGDAASGKTTVCLELAGRGHSFIADDAVVIERVGQRVFGSAANTTSGLFSSRTDGIREIPSAFGHESGCEVDQIVEIREPISASESNESQFDDRFGYHELLRDIPRSVLIRHTLGLAFSIEALCEKKIKKNNGK